MFIKAILLLTYAAPHPQRDCNRPPDTTAEFVTNKKFFSRQLKKYLIDKPFYSLEEFMDSWQTHDGGSICQFLII